LLIDGRLHPLVTFVVLPAIVVVLPAVLVLVVIRIARVLDAATGGPDVEAGKELEQRVPRDLRVLCGLRAGRARAHPLQDQRKARHGPTVLLQGKVSSRCLHRSGTDLAGDGCIFTELEIVDLARPDVPLEDLPSIRVRA
jgi:hypothetical protein